MILSNSFTNTSTKIKAILIILVSYMFAAHDCISQSTLAYTARPPIKPYFHFDSTRYYADSVVYLFNTNRIPKADNEMIRPLLFRIKLPPGLQFTYTSGFDAFGFRYPQQQVVYVYLNRYSNNKGDTSYRVTDKDEAHLLLVEKLNTVNHKNQLDIDNNPFDNNRFSWIIKKGKATILLYNIQKENMARFRNYLESFTFL